MINIAKVLGYHQLGEEAHISYSLGGKPGLDLTPDEIQDSDCSGWSRYLLYHGSDHALIWPEGSAQQHEWCEAHGLHKVEYAGAVQYGGANRLFVAFIVPETQPDGIGHVWLLRGAGDAARTIECYGGHGVGSRVSNATIDGGRTDLARACGACYELPVAP